MSNRQKRIYKFNEFKNNLKIIFNDFVANDKSSERLARLCPLRIVPGGRDGGHDEKFVEVFYGRRIIGTKKVSGSSSLSPNIKFEFEYGATLSYYRTDVGHVICRLQPAKSENLRPIENMILFDYIEEPSQLEKKAEDHWKKFIAYMEVTSIDGEPTIAQKFRVFRLRYFNKYIVDGVLQESKFTHFWKGGVKYIATIGLSGFLILLFTYFKDDIESASKKSDYTKLNSILEESRKNTSIIIEQLTKTNKSLETVADETKKIHKVLNRIKLNKKISDIENSADDNASGIH